MSTTTSLLRHDSGRIIALWALQHNPVSGVSAGTQSCPLVDASYCHQFAIGISRNTLVAQCTEPVWLW
jgi:hypothetical protein